MYRPRLGQSHPLRQHGLRNEIFLGRHRRFVDEACTGRKAGRAVYLHRQHAWRTGKHPAVDDAAVAASRHDHRRLALLRTGARRHAKRRHAVWCEPCGRDRQRPAGFGSRKEIMHGARQTACADRVEALGVINTRYRHLFRWPIYPRSKNEGHALRALALHYCPTDYLLLVFVFAVGLTGRTGLVSGAAGSIFTGSVFTGSVIASVFFSAIQLLLFTVPLGMTVLHKVAPVSVVSAILAPVRSASVRSAFSRIAPVRLARSSCAPRSVALFRLASVRLACDRLARARLARVRLDSVRVALPRLALNS